MSGRAGRDERGAVLIIVALIITAIFLIVAIVVDLGATRSDRRNGQLAVDNATASATQTFAEASAVDACNQALALLAITLEVPAFTGANCAVFASCSNGSPASVTATSEEYTVTIHHPVLDSSSLMAEPSTIGNTGVTAGTDEGLPCDRFGVEVTTAAEPFFGDIAGSGERTSTAHAVGRIKAGTTLSRPLNLLALERYSCGAINVSGQGEVVVTATNIGTVAAPQYIEGVAASDSNATVACSGNAAVLETSGQGNITANGPCPGNDAVPCVGAGIVGVFTSIPGPGACTGNTEVPACKEGNNANSFIEPDVTQTLDIFTRAPIDYIYNCKSDYSGETWYGAPLNQPIGACPGATSNTAYHDALETFVAQTVASPPAPPAWTVTTDCSPAAGTVFTGNHIVDCGTFSAQTGVEFRDGNVIFTGNLRVQNGDSLLLHGCPPCGGNLGGWSAGDDYDENTSSPNAGWVYVSGEFELSGNSVLTVNKSAVFIGPSGRLNMTGGTIPRWEGPTAGPFEDLALWSEGTNEHRIVGDGTIDLVGVFFNGQATFRYSGDGNQVLDEAQFVANKFNFDGQGRIELNPTPDRAVEFPVLSLFGLIR